jgi:hypothetical protein
MSNPDVEELSACFLGCNEEQKVQLRAVVQPVQTQETAGETLWRCSWVIFATHTARRRFPSAEYIYGTA